jgi:UPF0755 protein
MPTIGDLLTPQAAPATPRPAASAAAGAASAAPSRQSTVGDLLKPASARPANAPAATAATTASTARPAATPAATVPASAKPALTRPPSAAPASAKPASATATPSVRTAAAPAAARPAASAAPQPAAAPKPRDPSKTPLGAGDPVPPISDRLVRGIATAPSDANGGGRINPRSPRIAIEPDTVDLPARRSAGARHPLVVIGNAVISIFVLLAVVTGTVLFIGKQRFEQPGPLAKDTVVNIPKGGVRDIADTLQRQGVIDQPYVFMGSVVVLKAASDLKAGEYQFKAHASLRDVVATMVEGKVVEHQVSLPEGLTSEQIVAKLGDDNVLIGDVRQIPREGTLLPDTYDFTRGVTREQLLTRMQQAQQRLVKDVWDHRSPDLPLKSPDQLIVLASIIEKETGKPDERTRVAAVFVNRLKQNMKLQSDPTIIYGLVGGKGTLGRPIQRNEIEQPTPYNTYVITGLPPGPITNPGRASLEAAANPARTRELYFVADGTGGHAFAETYEQHQKNVARLRAMESDQRDQAPLDAPTAAAPAAASGAPAASAAPPRAAAKPRSQAPGIAAPPSIAAPTR